MPEESGKHRKTPALFLMTAAVSENFGLLWLAHVLELDDLRRPSDMSLNPAAIFALMEIFFASTICACLLLSFLYSTLEDFNESLLRTAVAMALAPWTAFLCAALVLPLFPIGVIVGTIAPYIMVARWKPGRT
jgi:hypothetical protein